MMINKKLNLTLKLNNSFTSMADQPFTPLEQTMRTPIDQPMIATPQGHPGHANGGHANGDYFRNASQPQQHANHSSSSINSHTLYQNPHYNESDDILTDIDEPLFGSFKTTKNYTVNFTHTFDQLLLATYQYFLGLPTTTPFSGVIPPSGLVSKVSNEMMSKLLQATAQHNHPAYDHQNLVSADFLRTASYKPIFLQLIRKRLIDMCSCNHNGTMLPQSTSITITTTSGGGNGAPYTTTTTTNMSNSGAGSAGSSFQAPPFLAGAANGSGGNYMRQSSISNLSLTELNISNYNNKAQGVNGGSAAAAAPGGPPGAVDNRSRSSSMSLRKQSLTRNNSYSGNNWLHVGNLNNIKSDHPQHPKFSTMHNDNLSTDSLQSIQDYVPQSFINKTNPSTASANGSTSGLGLGGPAGSLSASGSGSGSGSGFNAMMMDYQTPPSSQKGSISHQITPPSLSTSSNQLFNSGNENLVDDFNFYATRSRSSSRGTTLPRALHINTDNINQQSQQQLQNHHNHHKTGSTSSTSSMNGGGGHGDALDSPFMSSTTPSEDCGYFSNGFPVHNNNNSIVPHSPMYDNDNSSISSTSSTGSLRGTGIATVISSASANAATLTSVNSNPQAGSASANGSANANAAASNNNNSANANGSAKDSINLPSQFSLSEKKRDSLKLKRGIH